MMMKSTMMAGATARPASTLGTRVPTAYMIVTSCSAAV